MVSSVCHFRDVFVTSNLNTILRKIICIKWTDQICNLNQNGIQMNGVYFSKAIKACYESYL